MSDGITIRIGKNDGITQALWKHVKEQNMEISDGFI